MTNQYGVLVGYDGSEGGKTALAWAADEARLRGVPLTICHAWQVVAPGFVVIPYPAIAEGAEALVEQAVGEVLTRHPGLEVKRIVECASAPYCLVDHGKDADLLVVGRTGSSPISQAVVGSVSGQVSLHSTGPVTVVKAMIEGDDRPILVATDGSETAASALLNAFEEAHLRGVPLRALCVWPSGYHAEDAPFLEPDGLRSICRDRFEEAVGEHHAKYPDVAVMASFVDGDPVTEVIKASEEAQLLVLGSRGLGSIRGLFLGSISHAAVHHAPCSVTVIHSPKD
jgi:nucleotide-binding universal stress UspA family protein